MSLSLLITALLLLLAIAPSGPTQLTSQLRWPPTVLVPICLGPSQLPWGKSLLLFWLSVTDTSQGHMEVPTSYRRNTFSIWALLVGLSGLKHTILSFLGGRDSSGYIRHIGDLSPISRTIAVLLIFWGCPLPHFKHVAGTLIDSSVTSQSSHSKTCTQLFSPDMPGWPKLPEGEKGSHLHSPTTIFPQYCVAHYKGYTIQMPSNFLLNIDKLWTCFFINKFVSTSSWVIAYYSTMFKLVYLNNHLF